MLERSRVPGTYIFAYAYSCDVDGMTAVDACVESSRRRLIDFADDRANCLRCLALKRW